MTTEPPSPSPAPSSAAPDRPIRPAARGRALARVGLVGNPSDGYGGKVVSFTYREHAADVVVRPAEHARLQGPGGEALEAATLTALLPRLRAGDLPPGTELLLAAWGRLRAARAAAGRPLSPEAERLELVAATTVPRQVGLAGSSALVVAALRALAAALDVELAPFELSELALAAEVEDLGIVAGPQDRVAQAYEGLVAMDFSGGRSPAAYTTLSTALLPPLFLAWTPQVGAPSGRAHAEVRARYERGDADVRAALAVFPRVADEALEALAAGDAAHLARLLDANFEARRSIWPLADSDVALVELARAHDAGAKLAGSGGAIVGVPRDGDPGRLEELARAYAAAGYAFLVPTPGVRTRAEGGTP